MFINIQILYLYVYYPHYFISFCDIFYERQSTLRFGGALCLSVANHIRHSDTGGALTGFSNSVVIMMIGLFVVGGAIFQTGLAKMISSRILKLAGDSELKLFVLIILVTAFIGAFVSNTGTVALMLPIVVSDAACICQ